MTPPPARPGGPTVLVGGYSPPAARRAGRLGDGFIAGGGASRQTIRQFYDIAHQAWQEAGKPGRPRFVCCSYFALGPDAEAWTERYIGNYYSFLGPRVADMIRAIPKTPDTIRAAMRGFEEIGADELILWPCVPELDQISLLTDVIR
jgi:alkanesulfonate monooxygenase SsuD/methylene tetrahydromethanopterin reductase-like flavin-dependent oxidoreductase (luciferase family)